MQYISLDKQPNQRFTLVENSVILSFFLQFFRGAVFVTVTDSDGNEIITSRKLGDRIWILPYKYEEKIGANFRFEDIEESSPEYGNYNGTCVLTRYTHEEAKSARETIGAIA